MEKATTELKQSQYGNWRKAYHDSILQRHASQLERLEQLWDWGAIRLWIRGGTCGGNLGRSKVANPFGWFIDNILACEVLMLRLRNIMMMLRHDWSMEWNF